MGVASGCHHVALVTNDLDRVIGFYRTVFDATLEADLVEPPLRHVFLDLGGGFILHPFTFEGGHAEGAGKAEIFTRGHVDHLAVDMPDAETFELVRARLRDIGASDGTIINWGGVVQVMFNDPDGMYSEISLRVDAPVRTYEQMTRHAWPEKVTDVIA